MRTNDSSNRNASSRNKAWTQKNACLFLKTFHNTKKDAIFCFQFIILLK
jgi:hypothetical protein